MFVHLSMLLYQMNDMALRSRKSREDVISLEYDSKFFSFFISPLGPVRVRIFIPFFFFCSYTYTQKQVYRLVWATKVELAAICLVFPALVLGYYFFIVESMTYQFLYRLKNFMTIAGSDSSDISSVIP
jgi:hypothetical protein